MTAKTREPQYQAALDIANDDGVTRLGLMTNQVWHDDPRRLAILLARYKFVAKMLSGAKNVLEVGCADAFGTRIVQQEVEWVTALDFDPVFIADAEQRMAQAWPMSVAVHDMLSGPFPARELRRFDGAYTLDVIEHIAPSDEEAFVANLAASLTDNGVLIVGSPSLSSQAYASPASKAGHINCKTAAELKGLLSRHFGNVFVFSMNDEVVHTGFHQMAHYYFALCCGPKR
ncbi:MAG: class I SAM-dependent methyltransferase [Alphaproteobacteria bacterium]|nr:class I SAM-dependent methyltransferase [Alphaproteobacteria bacterium]